MRKHVHELSSFSTPIVYTNSIIQLSLPRTRHTNRKASIFIQLICIKSNSELLFKEHFFYESQEIVLKLK